MTQNKCQIHDDVLKRDKKAMSSGLTGIDMEYLEAKGKLFPLSNSYVTGG